MATIGNQVIIQRPPAGGYRFVASKPDGFYWTGDARTAFRFGDDDKAATDWAVANGAFDAPRPGGLPATVRRISYKSALGMVQRRAALIARDIAEANQAAPVMESAA